MTLEELDYQTQAVMTNRTEPLMSAQFALRAEEGIREISGLTIPLMLVSRFSGSDTLRDIAPDMFIRKHPSLVNFIPTVGYEPLPNEEILLEDELIVALKYSIAMKFEPARKGDFARFFWQAINKSRMNMTNSTAFQDELLEIADARRTI